MRVSRTWKHLLSIGAVLVAFGLPAAAQKAKLPLGHHPDHRQRRVRTAKAT